MRVHMGKIPIWSLYLREKPIYVLPLFTFLWMIHLWEKGLSALNVVKGLSQ